MTSYSTTGAFDSHWQTPPADPNAFPPNQSLDDNLFDIFQSEPFQPYNTSLQGGQEVYGVGGQRVVSSGNGSVYSESASSPQGYASSTGYSTGATSFSAGGAGGNGAMDFDSMFNTSSQSGFGDSSPPFDFGNSLSCDFDTSGLQGLFTHQQPPQNLQPQLQQPVQGLSPLSTTNSPPISFNLSSNYNYQYPQSSSIPTYPQQYVSNQPAQSYPNSSRHASFSSGASPSYDSSTSLVEQDLGSKRRRVTLAETAGIVPQTQHSSSIAPTAFTVKADAYPSQLNASNVQPQAHYLQTSGQGRKQKAKSPVELIANAGISSSTVYNPRKLEIFAIGVLAATDTVLPTATYQLLPKPVDVAPTAKGKRGTSAVLPSATATDDKAAGSGGKRKKVTERGHSEHDPFLNALARTLDP